MWRICKAAKRASDFNSAALNRSNRKYRGPVVSQNWQEMKRMTPNHSSHSKNKYMKLGNHQTQMPTMKGWTLLQRPTSLRLLWRCPRANLLRASSTTQLQYFPQQACNSARTLPTRKPTMTSTSVKYTTISTLRGFPLSIWNLNTFLKKRRRIPSIKLHRNSRLGIPGSICRPRRVTDTKGAASAHLLANLKRRRSRQFSIYWRMGWDLPYLERIRRTVCSPRKIAQKCSKLAVIKRNCASSTRRVKRPN